MLCSKCFEEVAVIGDICEDCYNMISDKDEYKSKLLFSYSVKGVPLDIYDAQRIHEYYEAYCTAEYLYDNYPVNQIEAMELGYKVRALMDKKEINEEKAIFLVLKEQSLL